MDDLFFYNAYGLNIRSDFPLPELLPGGTGENLYIQKGKVILPAVESTSIERQGIEALFGGNSESAYLHWPGVVKILAEKGNTLTVEPDSDSIDPKFLNLFILSEALGLILYQKGLFLLHASAVKVSEGAIVFVGPSGAGKSTTAAAFARAGHIIVADEMVAMNLDETDGVLILPAFPQLKIWPSAAIGLHYDTSLLPKLYPGSRKYVVPQRQDFPTAAIPLISIYTLQDSQELEITKLSSREGFFSLLRFFSCPSGLLKRADPFDYFYGLVEMIRRVPIKKLERPRNFNALKELVNQVEKECYSALSR